MTNRYVHGSNGAVDDPLVWYNGATVANTARHWLHADHLGSIVASVDNSGGNPGINTYDEYGFPGANNGGRFQYTGQVWLPEIGLYYYKARMYSPRDGRFLQTDAVGYAAAMNLYGYVGNDPVNRADPTGNCPTPDIKCPAQERMKNFFTGSRLGPAIGSPVQSTGWAPQQQGAPKILRNSSMSPPASSAESRAGNSLRTGARVIGAVGEAQHAIARAGERMGASSAATAPLKGYGFAATVGAGMLEYRAQRLEGVPVGQAAANAGVRTGIDMGVATFGFAGGEAITGTPAGGFAGAVGL